MEEFISNKVDKRDFDMIQNIRRASRSTTRNIAEGFGRYHFKQKTRFCSISRGSIFEIMDDLITCIYGKRVKEEDVKQGIELIDKTLRSLNGYIKYLNSMIN